MFRIDVKSTASGQWLQCSSSPQIRNRINYSTLDVVAVTLVVFNLYTGDAPVYFIGIDNKGNHNKC